MKERPIFHPQSSLVSTCLAASKLKFTENQETLNAAHEKILRDTHNIQALLHNAEMFTDLNNPEITAHFLELDILSLDGHPAIGHSQQEIVKIPDSNKELSEVFDKILNNNFSLHIDLKDSDLLLAQEIYDMLPSGPFISTPHHEVLDPLNNEHNDKLLLYTINSRMKKKDFERRILSGDKFTNCGVSIQHTLLQPDDVKFFQNNNLYVLAYSADQLDIASKLCTYGVNGITSENKRILELIATQSEKSQ